jgi:hypothetical protein
MGQDDVGRKRGQFRRMSANFGGIVRGPADVDPYVAADGPAQLPQPLQERPDPGLIFRIVRGCGQEHTDAPHPLALLRPRRKRPSNSRPAEKRDELASSQLIEWHRRPSSQKLRCRISGWRDIRQGYESRLAAGRPVAARIGPVRHSILWHVLTGGC